MVRPPACERAQTWVSLRLDGELSELEAALLDSHLSRCLACAATARDAAGTATAIRATEPEPIPVPLTVPRLQRRGSRRSFFVAAAAALSLVVVVTGVGSVGAMHVISTTASTPKLHRVSAVAGGMSDDLQLLAGVRVLRTERPLPGRIVWPA